MCGRAYSTYTDEELEFRYQARKGPALKPNYNFSPTQFGPVILTGEQGREIQLARFGLVPPWEPEFKTKLATFNARSETIFESKLYKGPVYNFRVVVPLSGFYEWARVGKSKVPYKIYSPEEPILSFAGIASAWNLGRDDAQYSFSLLTTTPNALISKIHDRMPAILTRESEAIWLNPYERDRERISTCIQRHPSELLRAEEVSPLVNNPIHNTPELLTPVQQRAI